MGKASEIWKEIKPKVGEMLMAVNDIETQAEKAQEEAYQRGLEDAWKAARKIVCRISDGGYTQDLLDSIFGSHNYQSIMAQYSASDAVEKISKYEPEEQIQVGDEVILDGRKYVVLVVDEDGIPEKLLEPDGYTLTLTTDVKLPKTGRHYPQIAEVLRKMKEES